MKKLVSLVVVGSFLFASSVQAAPTTRNKPWAVEASYSGPGVGGWLGPAASGLYVYSCPNKVGCVQLALPRPAARINVEIVDTTGLPVMGHVFAGGEDHIAEICGASEEPIMVYGATEIQVQMAGGACADGTPSSPTTGVVRVSKA